MTKLNWKMLRNGNDVEKTEVTRISRQPSPIQIMKDQKQQENVEFSTIWVA